MKTYLLICVLIIDLVVGGALTHYGVQPAFDFRLPTVSALSIPTEADVTNSEPEWYDFILDNNAFIQIVNFLIVLLNFIILLWNVLNVILYMATFSIPAVSPILSGVFLVVNAGAIFALIPWGS